MVLALIASATACTLSPEGRAAFGTGATQASGGANDETGDADQGSDDGDGESESSNGDGESSGDAESSGAVTTDAPETSGAESSGGGSSSGDPTAGQEGPACGQAGDTAVQGSIGSANANQNCPTTEYTAVVAGNPGTVGDIEVLLDATVATSSEFVATLRSPSGTSVVLFDKHGNPFTDDFIGTYFDDASPSPVSGAAAPRNGCFAPDQSLSAFDGEPAGGTWTLTVQTCLFAVTVDSWELRITH